MSSFQPLTLSVELWNDRHHVPQRRLTTEVLAQAQRADQAEQETASLRQRLEEANTSVQFWTRESEGLETERAELKAQLEQAQKVWTDLSVAVSCSSPDGSAEIEQVEYAYERASQAEAALAEMQKMLVELRIENDRLRCDTWGARNARS